ncbi:MAG: hypothetical protein WBX25_16700 [Rhodomicrobium sp.]
MTSARSVRDGLSRVAINLLRFQVLNQHKFDVLSKAAMLFGRRLRDHVVDSPVEPERGRPLTSWRLLLCFHAQ